MPTRLPSQFLPAPGESAPREYTPDPDNFDNFGRECTVDRGKFDNFAP